MIFIRVLIPSSSGLHFKLQKPDGNVAAAKCLNPFFVRSSFQTVSISKLRVADDVLIPSSSGLHFKLLCDKSSFFTMAYKGGCRKSSGMREEPDTYTVVVHGVLNQWKKN